MSQDYEWILCYAKSENFIARVAGTERQYFETSDYPGRSWRVHDLTTQRTAAERPNSFFDMRNPQNGDTYPANPLRTWAVTRETFDEYYAAGKIVFPGDYEFLKISKPAFRYWKEDDMKKAGDFFGMMPASTKLPDDIGMSLDGTKEITELFEGKVFSYPKTTKLIKYFIDMSTKSSKNSIILDFFSGSATTAHAVMQSTPRAADTANLLWYSSLKNVMKPAKPTRPVTKTSARSARNAFAVPVKRLNLKVL